jgi:hypothetical protein
MDVIEKFELLTTHLTLEKRKKELELERFINDNNLSIGDICENLNNKLNDYRNSIENLKIWLDFIEPINNNKTTENEDVVN